MSTNIIINSVNVVLEQWTLLQMAALLAVMSMGVNGIFCAISGQTDIRHRPRPFLIASLGLFGSAMGIASLILKLNRNPLIGPEGPFGCVIGLSLTLAGVIVGLTVTFQQYWPNTPRLGWRLGLAILAVTTTVAWLVVAIV